MYTLDFLYDLILQNQPLIYPDTVSKWPDNLLTELANPNSIPFNKNWRDLLPSNVWDDNYWKNYKKNQSLQKRKMIADFMKKFNLRADAIQIKQKKILIISPKQNLVSIPIEVLDKISVQAIVAEQRGIVNNCFFIARDACNEQGFTGRVSTGSGASDFTGYGNHCINYQILDDGSFISFDLTTDHNIDEGMGNFQILIVRAKNLKLLLKYLSSLYGGKWKVKGAD